MIHIGDQQFYEDAFRDAFSHDVALVEGVRSGIVRNLTRSYRWIALNKLGLVRQPTTPDQYAVSARVVRADLTTEEFHREWRKIGILLRIFILFAAPLVGLYRRLVASRDSLARNMCLEDLETSDEILDWNPRFEAMYHSILHARDTRLVECVREELETNREETIAIVYGAAHMRSVIRELLSCGFHCSQSRWHIVIAT